MTDLLLLYPHEHEADSYSYSPGEQKLLDNISMLSASGKGMQYFLSTGKTECYFIALMCEISEHINNSMTDICHREWMFFSMRYFTQKYHLNIVTATRNITMFALFGLIEKASSAYYTRDKTLSFMNSGYERHTGKNNFGVTWYHVPQYTPALLAEADRLASIWQASGYSRKAITKTALIRLYGMELADRAYGNNGVRIPRDRQQMERAIEDVLLDAIQTDGYAIPGDMFKGYCKTLWYGLRPEFLRKYEMKYSRPTADEKRRFHLTKDEWIIREG